jgi:hypothetical protein
MSRMTMREYVVALMLFAAAACRPASLSQQVEARRLAADLRVQFTRSADAANRAVMADTDEESSSAASESGQASAAVQRDVDQLDGLLKSLGYSAEVDMLGRFKTQLGEYRKLDDEILPLAVENTNLKAQRLSFGPAREAADAFRRSLETALRLASARSGQAAPAPPNGCCAEALVAQATTAILEVLVLHAPHIAEAEDEAMTRMEQQMAASEAKAQKALDDLKRLIGPRAAAPLTAAAAALEQFKAINREIVTLSRRNSEVRSLALSLGRKRMLTAMGDEQLHALEDELAKHDLRATR